MSANIDQPYKAPQEGSSSAAPKRKRVRRYLPPTWVWVVVILCAALIALVRFRSDESDHAVSNIATLILTFLAALSGVIWFLFFSAYPRRVRVLIVVGGVAVLVLQVFLFPIDHLDGNLIPQGFRFRWSRRPDELLAKPVVKNAAAGVDLATTGPDDFPEFLGRGRTAHVAMPAGRLARDWQSHPPKQLWRQPIGAGWSAFSAVNGFAVTMEQRGEDELVTCYDARTGELKWSHGIKARHVDRMNMGGIGPRSTPTIHEGKVYALGATGMLHCLEGSTGEPVWPSKDLLAMCGMSQKEAEIKVEWGRSGSPLIIDNLVVVPFGGKGPYKSLIAFNKSSGEETWRGGDRNVSYSSPTVATLCDVRQILSVNEDNVTGHDPKTGKQLWSYDWPGHSSSDANSSQVLPVGQDLFLLSKAYGSGAALVEVSRNGNDWTTETLWHNKTVLKTKFTNVTLIGTSFFGLSDGVLECVDQLTGKREWKKGRYDQGQILGVGDLLLVQAESGDVVLCEANSEKHVELGRLAAIEGVTWNNLCLHGRLLLVRNAVEAASYELSAEK